MSDSETRKGGRKSAAQEPVAAPEAMPAITKASVQMMSKARDWENPAVVGINKRKAHVTLRSFTQPQQAFSHYRLEAEGAASPRQLWLNGDHWGFKLFDRPEDVPSDFGDAGYDTSTWDKVRAGLI